MIDDLARWYNRGAFKEVMPCKSGDFGLTKLENNLKLSHAQRRA